MGVIPPFFFKMIKKLFFICLWSVLIISLFYLFSSDDIFIIQNYNITINESYEQEYVYGEKESYGFIDGLKEITKIKKKLYDIKSSYVENQHDLDYNSTFSFDSSSSS